MSAFSSSSALARSFSAVRTVPFPSIVFLIPRPCATSWNIVFSKNALNSIWPSCDESTNTCAIGTRILSNFARITFSSCSRRVPFWSCTCSSFGRLMAIVLAPALAWPA